MGRRLRTFPTGHEVEPHATGERAHHAYARAGDVDGADATDIEKAFSGWHLIDSEPAPTEGMPALLHRAAPAFHLVGRTA